MKHSKKFWVAISGTMVVVIAGGCVGYTMLQAKAVTTDTAYQETALQYGNLELAFEEEGTTAITTVSQLPEFLVNAVTMTVEEVYVEAGDSVSEGDALLKLTEESMEAAKAYYEEEIEDAEDALATAEMNYETGVLEAEYTYQSTLTEADSADESYSASLNSLDNEVAEKKAEWENAKADIATYESNLSNGTYYTEAGITEKQAAVTTAQATVTEAQTAYNTAKTSYETAKTTLTNDIASLQELLVNTTNLEEIRSDIAALATQISTDYDLVETTDAQMTEAEASLEQAQSNLQNAQKAVEQATESYEKAVQEATQKKEMLENSLSQLESEYQKALRNAVTEKVDLENEYELAVLEGKYADSTYQATVSSLQSAVDSAQSTLDTLISEQEALLAVEDGVICAEQAGTLASVTYEAEDILVKDTAYVSYYDTQTISISVEVPQEDIARVAVGDTVTVSVSGARMGDVEGTVASIATSATTGGSVSNVTYAVEIQIDNSDGMLSSGSSATVSFCYGELEDVYYIDSEAVYDISDATANVKQYDADGNVMEVPVTIGEVTDQYTVIEEGISEGDICLIDPSESSEDEE